MSKKSIIIIEVPSFTIWPGIGQKGWVCVLSNGTVSPAICNVWARGPSVIYFETENGTVFSKVSLEIANSAIWVIEIEPTEWWSISLKQWVSIVIVEFSLMRFGTVNIKVVIFLNWLWVEDVVIGVEDPGLTSFGIEAFWVSLFVEVKTTIGPSIFNLRAFTPGIINKESYYVSLIVKVCLEIADFSGGVVVVEPSPVLVICFKKSVVIVKIERALELFSSINFKIVSLWNCEKNIRRINCPCVALWPRIWADHTIAVDSGGHVCPFISSDTWAQTPRIGNINTLHVAICIKLCFKIACFSITCVEIKPAIRRIVSFYIVVFISIKIKVTFKRDSTILSPVEIILAIHTRLGWEQSQNYTGLYTLHFN